MPVKYLNNQSSTFSSSSQQERRLIGKVIKVLKITERMLFFRNLKDSSKTSGSTRKFLMISASPSSS